MFFFSLICNFQPNGEIGEWGKQGNREKWGKWGNVDEDGGTSPQNSPIPIFPKWGNGEGWGRV